MYRLFCVFENAPAGTISISDYDRIHHLRDVLHVKTGEKIIVFDQKGNEYNSVIESITSKDVLLRIENTNKNIRKNAILITVACAIPKKSKFDDIIDKLTQLGVYKIIPLCTERTIIKLDSRKEKLRLERWNKIAVSAAQQSQRNTLPIIDPLTDIKQVVSESDDYDLKLIPALIDERKPLNQVVGVSHPKNILILIGPEGDFTPAEVFLAKEAGFIPVTLGELVFRVETAAVAVTSFLRLALL